jgi:hypothetical protein
MAFRRSSVRSRSAPPTPELIASGGRQAAVFCFATGGSLWPRAIAATAGLGLRQGQERQLRLHSLNSVTNRVVARRGLFRCRGKVGLSCEAAVQSGVMPIPYPPESKRRLRSIPLVLGLASIVGVQSVRPLIRHHSALGGELLNVAPNFLAGVFLPFLWSDLRREGWSGHLRNCVVSALVLCAYEGAQGIGLVPAHPEFDAMDAYASIAGAIFATVIGWGAIRRLQTRHDVHHEVDLDLVRTEVRPSLLPGHGDYTKERQQIFADLELEDLLASVRQKKESADDL